MEYVDIDKYFTSLDDQNVIMTEAEADASIMNNYGTLADDENQFSKKSSREDIQVKFNIKAH